MNEDTELEKLTQAYLDGSLNGEQTERLNALLLSDEQARRSFSESLNLDSAIAAAAEGWKLERELCPTVVTPKWGHWMAVAACVALFFVGGVSLWQRMERPFATVEKAVGVDNLAAGTRLDGQTYEIKAGTVELLTKRGARVIIEAPAEFQFESAQHLHMVRGRLSADVPTEAIGFTVTTPSGDAVDLGTRFGVDVPELGAAEIHVFEGEVIAKTKGTANEESLRAGDALAMHEGSRMVRNLRSSAFIQSDEMRELSPDRGVQSNAALDKLRADPAAIAILDFESESETSYPGVYRVVQGRWPGSRAPEFINGGDHLKLDLGSDQSWTQLTLAAWVRLDRLGAPYQSLLHADGWDNENFGVVHWMVNEATTQRYAVWGNKLIPGTHGSSVYPDSLTPVLADQGRWVHLATVYDSESATVRFYHNGKFDTEALHSVAYPAKLGPAQIGNWNQEERKLSGRVDELIILARVMSDDEIRLLFDAGNPYQ